MILFSEQPIDQANGLHRFAVIGREGFDTSLLLEFFENRFGIDLVLGGVNDDPWSVQFLLRLEKGWNQQSCHYGNNRDYWETPKPTT